MVDNPETMVNWFIPVGADIVTVHAETCKHLDALLNTIRERGCKAGVSLNPSTPESVLQYVLDKVDQILVMTVNPGFRRTILHQRAAAQNCPHQINDRQPKHQNRS